MAIKTKNIAITLSNNYATVNPGRVIAVSLSDGFYVSYPITTETEPPFALDKCPLGGGKCVNVWNPGSNWNGYFELRVVEKDLMMSGYGTVNAPCGGTAGLVFDPRDPTNKHLCIHEGTGKNDNLVINIGRCMYDVVSGYVICSGAPGSRNIVVVTPWSSYKRVSVASIAPEYGRVSCVPLGYDRIICAAGGSPKEPSYNCKVFEVSVDDIVKAENAADVTSLSSYKELATGSTYCDKYNPNFTYGYGDKFLFIMGDSSKIGVYDYKSGTLNEYDMSPPRPFVGESANGIIALERDEQNKVITVYTFDVDTGNFSSVGTVSYPEGADHALDDYPFTLAAKIGTNNAWIVVIGDGLVPAVDVSSGELALYSFYSGDVYNGKAKVYAHRLLQSFIEDKPVVPGVVAPEYYAEVSLPDSIDNIAKTLGINEKLAINVIPVLNL